MCPARLEERQEKPFETRCSICIRYNERIVFDVFDRCDSRSPPTRTSSANQGTGRFVSLLMHSRIIILNTPQNNTFRYSNTWTNGAKPMASTAMGNANPST